MENYFKEYKKAKSTLLSLVKENYSENYSLMQAEQLNLIYEDKDIHHDNTVTVYAHKYQPLATISWNVLNIEDSMVTEMDIRKIQQAIRNEIPQEDVNYEQQYLKIYLLICRYVLQHYKHTMSPRRAVELGIECRKSDLEYDEVTLCSNYGLNSGVKTWELLNIKRDDIPKAAIEMKVEEAKKQLIKLENNMNN